MSSAGSSQALTDDTLLVSVVTPSFGRPYLLANRTIPSVLAQTHPRWELLVVGDAAAKQVVDGLGDGRIRHLEPDAGDRAATTPTEGSGSKLVAALDRAGVSASGRVIASLEDGDAFTPHHLEEGVATLTREDVDLVYGAVLMKEPGTGTEALQLHAWGEPSTDERFAQGADVIEASSVCYRADLPTPPPGGDGADGADPHDRWRALRRAGARFTSIDTAQAIRWGGSQGSIHISLPSLPPLETFAQDVEEIFSSRWTSNSGPFCQRLEVAVADYLDVEHVVGAPSGDVALGMAFQAVRELHPDRDEVIVPSYTFPSTANAVIRAGLRPRFCDVDPTSLCATVETASAVVSSRTAAIVPVHAHGSPCDMPSFEELATRAGAMLVSDAAAAFGATWGDRRIGGFGDLEVFSLSSTKVMTSGEGGLLVCRDGELASLLRRIGRYGLQSDYASDVVGINGRLAELPAALALRSLPYFEDWLDRRRAAGERYAELLSGCAGVRLPQGSSGSTGTWKDVPLILDTPALAQRVAGRLETYGVQTRPYYRPLHRMEAFREFADTEVPVADGLDGRVLCVPIFNDISDEAVSLVAGVVLESLSSSPSAGELRPARDQ